MMKLYYTPGACNLNPHIALLEAELPYELVKVDLRAKTIEGGGSFLEVNPKGYVPALRTEDGEVWTENAIMVLGIADLAPGKRLAPPAGTKERTRLTELLVFIATELHKGMNVFYNPHATDALKAFSKERLKLRLAYLASVLGEGRYLGGEDFSVADGYAFYVLRSWKLFAKEEISPPALAAYYERLLARPSVQEALRREGVEA